MRASGELATAPALLRWPARFRARADKRSARISRRSLGARRRVGEQIEDLPSYRIGKLLPASHETSMCKQGGLRTVSTELVVTLQFERYLRVRFGRRRVSTRRAPRFPYR